MTSATTSSTTATSTTTTLTTTQATPSCSSGGQLVRFQQMWQRISSSLSSIGSSSNASRLGKSGFEREFCSQSGLRILIPFCGNSAVFQCQAVSKTFRGFCRTVLAHEGRLPLLDVTFAEFKNKAVALVQVVASRDLTRVELAGKAFYDVFKRRFTLLGNPMCAATFRNYSKTSLEFLVGQLMLQEARAKGQTSLTLPNHTKMVETMEVGMRIYEAMIRAYASLPVDQITPASYRATVAELKEFFIDNSVVDIEASLRQALTRHQTQAFNQEANAYFDTSLANAKVAAIKASLQQKKFAAESNALEAELAALRGTTGFNGLIDSAWKQRTAAEVALKAVNMEAQRVFSAAGCLTVEQVLALDPVAFTTTEMQAVQTSMRAKLEEFQAADAAYQRQMARLGELATFHPANGVITGGLVFEARLNLYTFTLDGRARAEATKIGHFYRELHHHVTDANRQKRCDRLHAVIDT